MNASGADGVPVAFGLHPYLSPPGGPREQWLVQLPRCATWRSTRDQIPLRPEDARPAQRLQLDDRSYDDGFDSVAEPARFSVHAGNRAIELELLEGYPCAQVFAPPSGRFICFEPMTAPANALRSGEGLRVLHPASATAHASRCGSGIYPDRQLGFPGDRVTSGVPMMLRSPPRHARQPRPPEDPCQPAL